tara:strand:+ start:873 stop:1790 length:918 start_codon:yes stop_codon:yes gene_type:complete
MSNKTKKNYKKNVKKDSRKISKIYNKNKSKKNFKKLRCSPKKEFDFTCFNRNSLNLIKSKWNKTNNDSKILTNNSREIWEKLREKIGKRCKTEKCWLNQKFMKNNIDLELLNYTFAPVAPSDWKDNPNEWLTSNDIIKVMRQYEYIYKDFIFIGPSPIDFDKLKPFGQCVWNKLCNFNLKTLLKKGKKKIGIVFNTDPHDLPGAHWICMFIDISDNYIYYFDSNADKIPREINKFANKVLKQASSIGIKLEYLKNTTEHQKGNSECGMYVLYVIIQLLENKMKPKDFIKRIPDKQMENLRKVLFN